MSDQYAIDHRRWMSDRKSAFCIFLLLFGIFTACGDSGPEEEPTENDPETQIECEHHAECARDEICRGGVCESARNCGGVDQWTLCASRAERAVPGEGWMYACVDEQCRRMCVHDTDCEGENSICSDFGECITYDGTLLDYDSGDNTPGPLRAGVAANLLNVPIGVEMGGYGSRAKGNDGRYAFSLSASQGQMDAQYVRAVALDNGHNRMLLMRLPVVFSFSQLHERVARILQEETGIDWRDELVISSTHTHSGPTGFWRFPEKTAIDVGMLGAGKFHQQIEDWFVESMAETALDAINNMRDAKLGWTIVENYDPDDEIARDRWRSTPPFDMRRLLVMRIDDATTDKPIAALMSYASHGTSNSKDYLTDDVIGGAEHGVSQALFEHYGISVPTLYFSEAGGTMAPALGSFPYARDYAAHRVPLRVIPAFLNIVPKREVALRSRIYRFNISHDRIGYEVGTFSTTLPGTLGGVLYSGALLCNGKDSNDDDYHTHMNGHNLSCLGNIRMIIHNMQPTPLTRSQITALEIDGLHAITLPGEPAQEIGWQVLREMRDRFDLPTAKNWIFGYVNDHLLYMTPTNLRGAAPDVEGFVLGDGMDNPSSYQSLDDYPDFAFSYLQGGYETEMTPWGPESGDFLVDRAVDAFGWLLDPNAVPETHAPILPTQYTRVEMAPFVQDTTPDAEVGTIVEDAPSTIERMQPFTFTWIGGDHGVEAPQSPLVVLETKDENDAWVAAIGPDGLPIDNRGLAMATRLKILDEDGNAPRYQWSVYFQPLLNTPVGMYRLKVQGHYLSDSTNERTAYVVESGAFAIEESDAGITTVDYNADARVFDLKPSYPALVPMDQNTNDERAKLSGALRLIDPRVSSVDALAPIPTQDHALTAGGFMDATTIRVTVEFENELWNVSDERCDALPFDCVIETIGTTVPTSRIRISLPPNAAPTFFAVVVEDHNGNRAHGEWSAD